MVNILLTVVIVYLTQRYLMYIYTTYRLNNWINNDDATCTLVTDI